LQNAIPKREISTEKLQKISEIFQGLAYPVRLQILELLEDGNDYAVNEIRERVQIEASLLSHHLSKMKNIGIIDSYRQGRNIYYRLAIKEISKVFDCIYSCDLKL
jgi:DNA-binding transcriptional ArsR family regulator